MSTKDEVLAMVGQGYSAKEIAQALAKDYNHVTRYIRGFVRNGLLIEIPSKPGDANGTKRYRLSNNANTLLDVDSVDRTVFKALSYIEKNHPNELSDYKSLEARFERAINMVCTFPIEQLSDLSRRKTATEQARANILDVLREYERAVEILKSLLHADLVSQDSYPLLKSPETRAIAQLIRNRVMEAKQRHDSDSLTSS